MGADKSDRDGLAWLAWESFQRLVAALMLIGLLPLLALLYVAVRTTSPGPFLFRQKRRGRYERYFSIAKVRTMYIGSDRRTALGVASGDPTITRIGGILRATKLDELPQLWSIVRGDMLFVGPRPIPIALDEELRRSIPGFARRYRAKPGLSSLAQLCILENGLDGNLVGDWSRRFEAEQHYIARRRVGYDLVVIVLTLLYLLRRCARRAMPRWGALRRCDVTRVMGVPYANIDYGGVVELTEKWVTARQPRYISIAPVSSLIQAHFSATHRESLLASDLITADGTPIVWAQRALGHATASRVYGPTLMLHVLERAEMRGWRVGFCGGRPERVPLLIERLRERYPQLEIAGNWVPPFRPQTDDERETMLSEIRDARVEILFVGLGCPKQERWMYQTASRLGVVQFGVGAAFDFHAGAVPQAPALLQRLGLEWAFRLACEPRRLWRRYATTIPPFVMGFALQFATARLLRHGFQEPSVNDESA